MLVVLQRADSADMYEQCDCRLFKFRSTVQRSINITVTSVLSVAEAKQYKQEEDAFDPDIC